MLGGLFSQLGVIQLGTTGQDYVVNAPPTSAHIRDLLCVVSHADDLRVDLSDAVHVRVEP